MKGETKVWWEMAEITNFHTAYVLPAKVFGYAKFLGKKELYAQRENYPAAMSAALLTLESCKLLIS